ncbi:MAG: hypothetical protein AAF467_08070 [Actinomycetota bacterium]
MSAARPHLTALALATVLIASACGGEDEPVLIRPSSTTTVVTDTTSDGDEQTDDAGDATAASDDSPELEVSIPDDEPTEAAVEVVEAGTGVEVGTGDVVLTAWEMVAFRSGEVVESTTKDFGGPVPIEIGAGQVPAALDEALAGQTIGTRLDVQFPVGMPDLPDYLDSEEAYVLSVEIVDLAPEPEQAAPTTTAPPAPADDGGLLVPDSGDLRATPPSGAGPPTRNSFTVVSAGAGSPVAEGDTVELDYVMVSWSTGAEVLSTAADFGGTQTIVLGERTVPRFLESAIFQQPVGSRVQVVYAPDLFDLPEGLDRTDGYVVAVDIVSSG